MSRKSFLIIFYITLPHYHHYVDVFESIAFLKWLSCTLCIVRLRSCQFSRLSFLCNIWDFVNPANPFPLWWLREYVYFILLSSAVWHISQCWGLCHETMVCAVSLTYVLMVIKCSFTPSPLRLVNALLSDFATGIESDKTVSLVYCGNKGICFDEDTEPVSNYAKIWKQAEIS